MQHKQDGVYVFWDLSNIYIPAQEVSARKDSLLCGPSVRIHFENLSRLAIANRARLGAVAVGSVPREQKGLWTRFQADTGIEPELYERGNNSGKEQGVDNCLQLHMLRALVDEESPRVAVLLTGDGSGYDRGVGFHADMERMYKRGWGIEVLSWSHSCSEKLRAWAESVGVFVQLDPYFESITFLENGRSAKLLNLLNRKCATAQPASKTRVEERAMSEEKNKRKKRYNEKVNRRNAKFKKKRKKRRK